MHHELPARLDPDRYRKEAKRLVKAVRAGDAEARERAREVLGARVEERFLLSDAQHVVAVEHGYRRWADFVRALEEAEPEPSVARIGREPVEAYERRARELVEAARAGDDDAVRRVAAHVPRLEEFAGGELALRDAKLVVAREYGFPRWRDLVFFVEKAIHEHEGQREGTPEVVAALAAIEAGDVERLRELLDRHPHLAGRAHTGAWTTLLEAVAQPDVFGERLGTELGVDRRVVELLVARAEDLDGPLGLAACFNRAELVELLLAAGAGTGPSPIWDVTPLETALYHGAREAAELLAAREIVPYALWSVAALGRVDLLPDFFDADGALRPEAGAHRSNLADVGWPPGPPPCDDADQILGEALVHAAHNGRTDAVRWLLDRGVDVDAGPYLGFAALHAAAQFGHRATCELLVARGARLDVRDRIHDGLAAGWAEHGGHPELVPLLRGDEPAETLRETGLAYGEGEPVLVRVRRRGRRYDIDDRGRAAALAGTEAGWREVAERIVIRERSLNVDRRGVVSVPAFEGGLDVDGLVTRVAGASLALYEELLELA